MNYKVEITDIFAKQAKRLKKKYKSLNKELDELENELVKNPFIGASLGHNTFKIRLGVKSKGKGKRSGVRIITYVVTIEKNVFLLSIYDKSEMETIEDSVIRHYTKEIDEKIEKKQKREKK